MSKMDFSELAQMCVDAEMNHMATGLSGNPTIAIGMSGNHIGKISVHILSGLPNMPNASLSGTPLKYIARANKTIILLKCAEIRQFYKNLGWSFEDFLHSNTGYLH